MCRKRHATCKGMDAGTEQVSRGMAWVFEKYAPSDSPLRVLQEQAQTGKCGLWRARIPSRRGSGVREKISARVPNDGLQEKMVMSYVEGLLARVGYIAVALALAGCASAEQRAAEVLAAYGPYCEKLGYQKNTDAWRQCVQLEDARDAAALSPYIMAPAGYCRSRSLLC